MRQSAKGEGTKIAQAAKDLNVTSVTIRRYISEFNIETTSDENGIKVLPEQAMEELHEIRRLKEDGLTNPKVLEHLEEMRAKGPSKTKAKKEAEPAKKTAKRVTKAAAREEEAEEEEEKKPEPKKEAKRVERKVASRKAPVAAVEEADDGEDEAEEEVAPPPPKLRAARIKEDAPVVAKESEGDTDTDSESDVEGEGDELGDGKSKHTLTCQTCGKNFEHMNPRLRDCLECYRAKRKERRRGGDKNRNVIQHPLAQQVANKQQARQQAGENGEEFDVVAESGFAPREERTDRFGRDRDRDRGERGERGDRGERDRDRGDRDRGERGERGERGDRMDRGDRGDRGGRDRNEGRISRIDATPTGSSFAAREAAQQPLAMSSKRINPLAGMQRQAPVRNYRKAIEETRSITSNLKRRLERPDLPENERRWLEQIYAYQLILHQGWRHLAEYKAGNQPQSKAPAPQD